VLVAAVRDACSASDRRALLPHRGSLTRAAAGPQADDEEAEADEVAEALRLQKAAAAALAPEDFGLGAGAADGDAASSGGEEDGDERGAAAPGGRPARAAPRRPPPRARASPAPSWSGAAAREEQKHACVWQTHISIAGLRMRLGRVEASELGSVTEGEVH